MSRMLTLLLASILIVAAAAEPEMRIASMGEQTAAHHKAVMEKARAFGALQSSSIASNCSTSVQDQLKQLQTDCATVSTSILVITSADQAEENSRKVVEQLCQADCTKRAVNFMINNPCLSKDTVNAGKALQWSCTVQNGMTCGARFAAINPNCRYGVTEAMCGNRLACEWKARNASSSKACYEKAPTKDSLDSICAKDSCLDKYFQMTKDAFGAASGMTAASIKDAACMKIDGEYCQVALAGEVSESASVAQLVDKFCSSSVKSRCYVRYTTAAAAMAEASATSSFEYCMSLSYVSTNFCLRSLASSLIASDKSRAMAEMLCSKTNASAAGESCLVAYTRLLSDASYQVCSASAMFVGTCSASCNMLLSERYNALGCCAASVGRTLGNPLPADARIPGNNGSLSFVSINSTSFYTSYSRLEVCSLVKGNTSNYGPCQGVKTADAPKKSLATAMSYPALQRKNLIATVTESLATDIAASLGIERGAIVNPALREDSTRKVKVPKSRQQSTSENAATLDFQIAASDSTSTTAAASSFDKAVAGNTLSTTSTSNSVSACSNCVDESAGSSVAATTASSSAIRATVAAAVAISAALFFAA